MKTIKLNLMILLASTLLLSSCEKGGICINGSGEEVTQTIELSHFSKVELAEAANVYISQGPVQKVTVKGQQNIIDRLKLDVYDNAWKIDLERGCYQNYDLDVYITVANLEKVSISGSGNVTVN